MSSSVSNQASIGCLTVRSVLGRSGQQFQREVERLTYHMGPEWVCTRFKHIWNAANHLRNGDRDSAQAVYRENGIAYHKGDMTPKGPFRPAVRGYIHARRPSVIKRYAAVLRYYTTIRLTSLSETQSDKAYHAITDLPAFAEADANRHYNRAESMAMEHVRNSTNPVIRGLRRKASLEPDWIPPMRSRYADGLRATSAYFSEEKLPRALKGEPYASMTLSFITNSYVPESLDRITPIFEMRNFLRDQDPRWDLKPVGRIVALQEQGAKARVIAMPSAHLQLAFMPLHSRLAGIAEHAFSDQSVVKDQQRGAYGVLRHLSEGKEVHSVDLSSATDRFPRDYSIQLLKELGMRNYARALDEVCSKPWDSPWGPITYGTGQPMGLYGSFPLFHLSNLMVASEAERFADMCWGDTGKPLEKFQNGSTFYVVGDDIVFSDARVASEYRSTMEELGAPISEHKSFSGKLAEFAGFIVTESREGHVAFRPFKIPDSDVDEIDRVKVNFLDAIGHKASLLSPRWKKEWDLYKITQSSRGLDLSPLIAEPLYKGPSAFRGDSQTLVNLSNALTLHMGEKLPDLGGSTKINTIPAFSERGVFDYYGFSPEELRSTESIRSDVPGRNVKRRFSSDPLIRELKQEQRGETPPVQRLLSNKKEEPNLPEESASADVPKEGHDSNEPIPSRVDSRRTISSSRLVDQLLAEIRRDKAENGRSAGRSQSESSKETDDFSL